jgi:hypothetical protein
MGAKASCGSIAREAVEIAVACSSATTGECAHFSGTFPCSEEVCPWHGGEILFVDCELLAEALNGSEVQVSIHWQFATISATTNKIVSNPERLILCPYNNSCDSATPQHAIRVHSRLSFY